MVGFTVDGTLAAELDDPADVAHRRADRVRPGAAGLAGGLPRSGLLAPSQTGASPAFATFRSVWWLEQQPVERVAIPPLKAVAAPGTVSD